MRCPGCGEDFHGAASCLANMRWLLARERDNTKVLSASVQLLKAAIMILEDKVDTLQAMAPGGEGVPALLQKPSRSEQMKAIWAARKAAKVN